MNFSNYQITQRKALGDLFEYIGKYLDHKRKEDEDYFHIKYGCGIGKIRLVYHNALLLNVRFNERSGEVFEKRVMLKDKHQFIHLLETKFEEAKTQPV